MYEELLTMTEFQLRDWTVPFPKTKEELNEIVSKLETRTHDYGTCVYAMSIAAVATYNYMCHILGTTGFQSGAASLDILARIRNYKCGFRIINYENLLYPQYMDEEHFPTIENLVDNNIDTLSIEAQKRISDSKKNMYQPHPDVLKRWLYLRDRGMENPEVAKKIIAEEI